MDCCWVTGWGCCGCVKDSAKCIETGIGSGMGEGDVPLDRLGTLFASGRDAAAGDELTLGRSVLGGLGGLKALIRGETLEVWDGRFEKILLSDKKSGVGVGHKAPYLTVANPDVWGSGKE